MAKTAGGKSGRPARKGGGKQASKRKAKKATGLRVWRGDLVRRGIRIGLKGIGIVVALVMVLIVLFAFVNPPVTHTMWTESRRLGGIDRQWVPLEEVAPVLARSVVAAEDANFCHHWGFDLAAIRAAVAEGAARGGSTITQQVVKNVFLWQGRSWTRKAIEAALTPAVEAVWSKRRILEVYLNVAEMGEGVFGAEAAARKYFGVGPDALSARQAAALAAVLPAPKNRNPTALPPALRKRSAAIRDGAATIAKDGRASCFED